MNMPGLRIGPYSLPNPFILAPMAGVTDLPFRELCKRMGAGMAVSEMMASNPRVWGTAKSLKRADHRGEAEPRVVQIAGGDPAMVAMAARYNVQRGAQIIDINMGCPAKKVCNKLAGSALLADEDLVGKILRAAVAAVDVPVTVKIRTGPSPQRRNAVTIARMAEDTGIAAIAIHGRTRACAFCGDAEYDTIHSVKQTVDIPVIANGDIDSPAKARDVLAYTGADAIMIGRAAQGRPWLFTELNDALLTKRAPRELGNDEVAGILLGHLRALHGFYGEHQGVRIARKHIGWYLKGRPDGEPLRRMVVTVTDADRQLAMLAEYFERTEQASQAA